MQYLIDEGVQHLLVDLPSGIFHLIPVENKVDREEDAGALVAHRTFWNIPLGPKPPPPATRFSYIFF